MDVNRASEPAYAGIPTFNKVPLALDPEGLVGADVVILGAPMDELVTHRPGARFGPRAIRSAYDGGGRPRAWHMDVGIDPFAELVVVDHGDAEVVPADARAGHRAIREAVGRIVDAGAIPIVLGGDHSIAYPDIAAVAERRGREAIGVVQFDTHADTATDNWGVRWAHGTPFRNLIDHGIIDGGRLVQIGLRGYWPYPEEWEWMRSAGVRWHRMDEVVTRGIDPVIDSALEETRAVETLYLSVDIDVLDPAYAPGTGTPEPGGMTARELLRAVRRLTLERDVCGVEIVEVSPPYDHASITAMAAHRVVLEALTGIAARRRGGELVPEMPH